MLLGGQCVARRGNVLLGGPCAVRGATCVYVGGGGGNMTFLPVFAMCIVLLYVLNMFRTLQSCSTGV